MIYTTRLVTFESKVNEGIPVVTPDSFIEQCKNNWDIYETNTDGVELFFMETPDKSIRYMFSSKKSRYEFFTKHVMLEYAKLMCGLQKAECVKAYNNSTSQFRVSEDILKAPLPPGLT